MEDERLVLVDGQKLRQIRLRRADIDERITVVPEDAEALVEVEVDRGGLQIARVVRVDPNVAGVKCRPDVPARQDAHPRERPVVFGRMSMTGSPRSANRVSTSR